MTDDTLWRYVHMYSIGFCWCFNWTSNSAKQMFDSYLLRTFEKMVSKLFRNWKVRVVPFACRFSIGLVAKRASGGGESAGEAEKGEDAEVCVVSYQYPFEVRAVLQERFFGHLICLKDMPHISSSYEIDVFFKWFLHSAICCFQLQNPQEKSKHEDHVDSAVEYFRMTMMTTREAVRRAKHRMPRRKPWSLELRHEN